MADGDAGCSSAANRLQWQTRGVLPMHILAMLWTKVMSEKVSKAAGIDQAVFPHRAFV